MFKRLKLIYEFRLTQNQWKILAAALSNIGQGVILFSLAAVFVPRAVSLPDDFSKEFAVESLIGGIVLLISAIIASRDKK